MRERLVADEQVARMYQEPGLACLEPQAEVAEELVALRKRTAENRPRTCPHGLGDSNYGLPPEVVPGGGCAAGLTCGSLAPVVTDGARCAPLPAGSACTHRVPAGSGPVRSRTPLALRSSAARNDRPAAHGKAARSRPSGHLRLW
jgi:hypothetical protein